MPKSNDILSADTTEYVGALVYTNGKFSMYNFGAGYIEPSTTGTSYQYRYYMKDHLGNNRVVSNLGGTIIQTNHYYPYGANIACSTNSGRQQYKYNGKELDRTHGLNWYDYLARQYDAALGQFTSMDPLCEKYYHISPYVYCGGNPINSIDPDGRSTWVVNEGKNQFKVIGGNINDNDFNIYVYTKDPNGEYLFQKESWTRGESIGQTPTITSFYNSDCNSWSTGSVINTQDLSGINFINKMKNSDISLSNYMCNARNGHEYDFKITNGIKDNKVNDIYRGMPIKSLNGKTLYTSARDIGNMVAGFKAGASGIEWKNAEKAFDMYQSRSLKITEREGNSTKNAERYGYMLGRNSVPMRGSNPIINYAIFISNLY